MTRRRFRLGAALTASSLLGLALLTAGPVAPAGAAVTGPGSYFLGRSQATGNAPQPADNAACDAYLGFPHNIATIQRLDAVLNAPVIDPNTGTITNGVAAPVAPAYLCGALGGDGGLVQSYARTTLQAVGSGPLQVAGPCDIGLSAVQLGSALAECKLAPLANTGTPPAVVTTNSVVNPFSTAGAQTGSLITAYLPGTPAADDGPPPSAAPIPVPGATFRVLRDGGSVTQASSSDCPSGWRARVSTVKAGQVARTTGRVAAPSGPNVGTVTVCYEKKQTTGTVKARSVIRVGSTTLRSEGTCQFVAVSGIGTSVAQTCGLWLKAPFGTIQDGLTTGQLLVPSGDPAGATDSGVWTIATLGGQ